MKRTLCLAALLVSLLLVWVLLDPPESDAGPWPSAPTTLWVSSDLHWQPPSASPRTPWLDEIIDAFLDAAVEEAPQALVLCGDLTNDGTMEEHRALSERLKAAQAAGLRIFVTLGNHDMDRDLPPETLTGLYAPFGWDQALSRDESSMSYLAQVTDRLWLLSLDCNRYGDRGEGVAWTIGEETLAWVEECLDRAREAGALVLPFSHHNLVIHNMNGDANNYNIDGGEALAGLLLDRGVPLYLSGHRHNSFLARTGSGERTLTEAVVATPLAWPHYYTALTFLPERTVDHRLETLDIEAWAEKTGREEPELLGFRAWSEDRDRREREENAARMLERMDLTPEERASMTAYFLDFCAQFQNHRLWQEGERLRRDPALELWKVHAGENVYARWMPWILENQAEDAPDQLLGPFR